MADPGGRGVKRLYTLLQLCFTTSGFACATYLLVEDHVHAVGFDVMRELAQEGQDVLYAGRVGKPP